MMVVLSIPTHERERIIELMKDDPEAAQAELESAFARARTSAAQGSPRERERREGVEEIIRESAEWGYDVAKAGAPWMVPDIEWESDGTWRITTEIPEKKPFDLGALLRATQGSSAIKRLEQEIIELEKEKRSGALSGGMSFMMSGKEDWLQELKNRLRVLDPANPFAM